MKNIIVPTDFSVHAGNALKTAISIANHFEAKIHLIHVYLIRSQTGSFISVRDFMEKDAKEELATVLKQNEKALGYGTTIEAKAIEGRTIDAICKYATRIKADLIVMGTQGASGLKEIFMGSNTSGLISKSKTPILAVPNAYQYRPFKNIAFAVDSDILTSPEVLDPMKQIARAYNASIDMVQVKNAREAVLVDVGLDIYLSDIRHEIYTVDNNNVNEGINHFVENNKADLLCMIHRHRSFLDEVFHQSVTRKESFNTTVPLLVLME